MHHRNKNKNWINIQIQAIIVPHHRVYSTFILIRFMMCNDITIIHAINMIYWELKISQFFKWDYVMVNGLNLIELWGLEFLVEDLKITWEEKIRGILKEDLIIAGETLRNSRRKLWKKFSFIQCIKSREFNGLN